MIKNLFFSALFVAVVSISLNETLYAQPGHIHQNHPTTGHGAVHMQWWHRTSLTTGPTSPTAVAGPSVLVLLLEHSGSNGTCVVGVTTTAEHSSSVTHTCSVGTGGSVGGSVEAAAGALFAKLAVKAEASVTFNSSWTDSTSETVTVSSTAPVPPCKTMTYKLTKLKKTSTAPGYRPMAVRLLLS